MPRRPEPPTGAHARGADRPAHPWVSAAAVIGCLVVVSFQTALTLGAPLGAAALGGSTIGRLPGELRGVTAASAVLWTMATLVVLARAGTAVRGLPAPVVRAGIWVVVALLAVSSVLNLASSSPWERYGWAPFSLTLCILCVILARSRGKVRPRPRRW